MAYSAKKMGLKIKQKRKELRFTQEDLASKLGITRVTVSKYESGSIQAPMDMVFKISDILDIPVLYLSEDYDSIDEYHKYLEEQHYADQQIAEKGPVESIDDGGFYAAMFRAFFLLNEEGRKKAMERVEELTEIERYRNSDSELLSSDVWEGDHG